MVRALTRETDKETGTMAFDAVRGVQAGKEFYTAMVSFKTIAEHFKFERVASAVESGDLDGAVRMFFHSVYSDPGWYDFAEREARMFCEGASPDELRRIVMAFHTTDPSKDISGLLDQVSVPALVTHGSEDQRIPIAAGRYIAEHIPDSVFYSFEGAGHLPIYTATAEFIDVLRTFIRTGTVPETSKGHD